MYLICLCIFTLTINKVWPIIPDTSTQILHHRCNLYDEEFWRAYMWNFKNSSEVHIITLVTKDSTQLIGEYITEMLSSLNTISTKKKLSFFIRKYSFKYLSSPNMLKNNTDIQQCEILEEIHPKEESTPLVEIKDNVLHERMRSFSADLQYAFNLVVWDIEDFYVFLMHKFTKIFPNPRGVYMISFISPSDVEEADVKFLFKKIWEDFGVLNIVFHMPCSCKRRVLYMYNPFTYSNSTWGELKEFYVSDAEEHSILYTNSLQSLNGYPLRIALFTRVPTVINEIPPTLRENRIYKDLTWSRGYIGLDGMIMGSLAERLNFTPVINYTNSEYGFIFNGRLFGIVYQVATRQVDISFNSRFVEGEENAVIEYLSPVINDKFCLIVPKASLVPQWLSFFRCFDLNSWCLIFFAYVISSLYWFLIRPANFKPYNSSFLDSFLHIFSIFISVPVHLTSSHNHRMFLTSCLLFNIIIVGSFQGQLVKSFSKRVFYPDIDTLEDFQKSGLKILSASQSTYNIFSDDGTELMKNLRDKIIISNISGIIRAISEGKKKYGAFERKSDALLRLTINHAEEKLHICKECPRSYFFSYIVPKGSPYCHVFNIVITMLREAGFINKWNSDVVDILIIQNRNRRKTEGSAERDKQFSLNNLQIPFYILMLGQFISLVVFFLELVACKM